MIRHKESIHDTKAKKPEQQRPTKRIKYKIDNYLAPAENSIVEFKYE
jgi:hypothetical protein